MFVLTTIVDTLRVPAHMLALPTLVALHKEIDLKFPNRVLMDVGLVVCRYGECLKISHGSCVPGDGGSHHECLFRLVVFRPFVEEVCVGRIVKSTAEGVQVSLGGFFQDIFIPAYWMLRPSHYDEKIGLWVWTPNYDEDDEKETEGNAEGEAETKDVSEAQAEAEDKKEEEEGDRFEMYIGAEIRFKVKSIQFTQVTNTAKGVQATTTTTAHSHTLPKEQEEKTSDKPLRKRSLSVDISDSNGLPATMHIVASICEDGLGLTSWWVSEEKDDDEQAEGGEEQNDDGDTNISVEE
jgi:DNA-directed RNA polymerase III subunit RPC8